jgi:hypothetical protein
VGGIGIIYMKRQKVSLHFDTHNKGTIQRMAFEGTITFLQLRNIVTNFQRQKLLLKKTAGVLLQTRAVKRLVSQA